MYFCRAEKAEGAAYFWPLGAGAAGEKNRSRSRQKYALLFRYLQHK